MAPVLVWLLWRDKEKRPSPMMETGVVSCMAKRVLYASAFSHREMIKALLQVDDDTMI